MLSKLYLYYFKIYLGSKFLRVDSKLYYKRYRSFRVKNQQLCYRHKNIIFSQFYILYIRYLYSIPLRGKVFYAHFDI